MLLTASKMHLSCCRRNWQEIQDRPKELNYCSSMGKVLWSPYPEEESLNKAHVFGWCSRKSDQKYLNQFQCIKNMHSRKPIAQDINQNEDIIQKCAEMWQPHKWLKKGRKDEWSTSWENALMKFYPQDLVFSSGLISSKNKYTNKQICSEVFYI